jgi:TatD DNase family protein
MLTDAHCHPFDLHAVFPNMEAERRRLGVLCAASASDREEFAYNETLARAARAEGAAGLLPCFAIHPQLPAYIKAGDNAEYRPDEGLALLESLAGAGRLAAVGETGFDLFTAQYRETEALQEKIFEAHLDAALRHELPLVLHVRRAMHKIFAASGKLKKCRAVVFHSWPGTVDDARALLGRGINGFFSFGTTLLLNHRQAMRSCAVLPAERLLLETDAPYQPLRVHARRYSSWEDLPAILAAATELRREAGAHGSSAGELERIIETNFRTAFDNSAQ